MAVSLLKLSATESIEDLSRAFQDMGVVVMGYCNLDAPLAWQVRRQEGQEGPGELRWTLSFFFFSVGGAVTSNRL